MPTYEYKCPKCGKEQDAFHHMNVTPGILCVGCSHVHKNKKPTAGLGTHFKGSGFYETDYKGKR